MSYRQNVLNLSQPLQNKIGEVASNHRLMFKALVSMHDTNESNQTEQKNKSEKII